MNEARDERPDPSAPAGGPNAEPEHPHDGVDEELEETFPASDPPANY